MIELKWLNLCLSGRRKWMAFCPSTRTMSPGDLLLIDITLGNNDQPYSVQTYCA